MTELSGLAAILGGVPEGYKQTRGPGTDSSPLPITYWYPAWWGISPWATPFWQVTVEDASTGS
jgi:hypothetical protein